MEVKFCRRCAAPLTKLNETGYECSNGHKLFYDASPAAACVLVTPEGKLVLTVRAVEPGKGKNSLCGGFVDYGESLEQALARELQEEVGLNADDYETPEYVASAADNYEWQGNVTHVLSAMYLVRLKPHAKLVPADDVADVIYIDPSDVPYANIAFPSNVVGIAEAIKRL